LLLKIAFADKPQQVLQVARPAPTAANQQVFKLIVMSTAGREAELKCIYTSDLSSGPWCAKKLAVANPIADN
jgi:hypothetical protein